METGLDQASQVSTRRYGSTARAEWRGGHGDGGAIVCVPWCLASRAGAGFSQTVGYYGGRMQIYIAF